MADRSNRSKTERLKYGICLNEECEKCKAKEIQQLPMRRDFLCSACGRELRECPPPKKINKGKLFACVAAVLVVVAVIIALLLSGKNTRKKSDLINSADGAQQETVMEDKINTSSDTVEVTTQSLDVIDNGHEIIESTVKTTETTITTKTTSTVNGNSTDNGQSTLKLSYGTYTGETKNGYPDGMGRLTYSQSRQINRHDTKNRNASAGDYVIGEFVKGFFVQGKHYSSDGNLIETLIIGVSADDEYESK